MRRLSAVLALVLVSGCGAFREAFSARPTVAARVGAQSMSVQRLAEVMSGTKGMPLTPAAAEFVADLWVDHALFARAVASGKALTDSTLAAEAMWPELSEIKGTRWHDTLLARRNAVHPEFADSIYARDNVRMLQHILIKVPEVAPPMLVASAKTRAEAALARLKHGEPFSVVAAQLTEDQASRPDSGFLPPAARGKWVAAFDSAGWKLPPGGTSGLVRTSFGFHIIHRPSLAEARSRLVANLRGRASLALDSIYLDSLGIKRHLTMVSGAAAIMRQALTDRDGQARSTRPVARYDGGQLVVKDFLRWTNALGTAWVPDMGDRPDSLFEDFARTIAQNQMLLEEADSAGIGITPEEWQTMYARYIAQVDTLRGILDLNGADVVGAELPLQERLKVASVKVERYWDGVAQGKGRPRPVPGLLAAALRSDGGFSVSSEALAAAAEDAKNLRDAADSASGTTPKPAATPAQPPAPIIMPITPPGGKKQP